MTTSSDRGREFDSSPVVRRPPRTITRWAVIGTTAMLPLGFALALVVQGPQVPTASPPGSGSVDVGFAQDVSVHHAQAVEMAALELALGSDQAVRGLAFDILTSRQAQIGTMQGWLTIWGQPPLPSGGYTGWIQQLDPVTDDPMPGMANRMNHEPAATMPGMATTTEMAALGSAAPGERDERFLELMRRHHLGGQEMLTAAADGAAQPYVRDLAAQMLRTQNAELQRIQQLMDRPNETRPAK